MAGMGLLGMAQGMGEGLSKIGQEQMKHSYDQDKADYLSRKQQELITFQEQMKTQKRQAFVGEMDRVRDAKLGADAQNLDQAAQIYRDADGLSEEDRQAGLAATGEARTRLGRLTPEEVGMAGLRTGDLEAKDYLSATTRAETSADKVAHLMAMKLMQEDRKDARQAANIDSRESIAEARNTTSKEVAATRGQDSGRLSLPQQVQNKEIDSARRIVAGLSEEEIKKRTAKFTNTGRDNPDYDEGLARRLRIAAKRKYGDDDWFDQQSGGEAPPLQAPTPGKALGIMERFQSDATMKSYKTGKATDRGLEVLDANGKLIGHYR